MIARLIGRFISIFRLSRNTARAVIFHEDDIFLVQHRLSGNYWSIPGGGLEKKETPEEGLKRELYEELGIKDFHFEKRGNLEYLSRRQVINSTIFKVSVTNKDMNIDRIEIRKHGWFPKNDLPEMMPSMYEAIELCR